MTMPVAFSPGCLAGHCVCRRGCVCVSIVSAIKLCCFVPSLLCVEADNVIVDPVYEALRYGTSLAQMSRSSFGSISESPCHEV